MSDGEISMEKKNSSARPPPPHSSNNNNNRGPRSIVPASSSSPNNNNASPGQLSSLPQNDQKLRQGWSDAYRVGSGGKNGRPPDRKPFPAPQRKAGPPLSKRPLPRVSSGPNGLRNQVGRGEEAELGSVSRPGSKKGGRSFNGLLGLDSYGNVRSRGWDHRYGRQRYTSTNTDYNKERFLQANCQFIVSDAFDYSKNLTDPDLLVEWDQIEEMRLLSEEMPCCPICLFPPRAAKMTRCGHIYCWSCILHYLSLSDEAWRKCPICYESVYGKQLKSLVATPVQRLRLGDTIRMRLMQREKGSTLALPLSHWTRKHKELMTFGEECSEYWKLLKIGVEGVREGVIGRERRELRAQLDEERDQPEAVFIHTALSRLDEREEAANLRGVMIPSPSPGSHNPAQPRTPSPNLHTSESVTVFSDAFEDVKARASASGTPSPGMSPPDTQSASIPQPGPEEAAEWSGGQLETQNISNMVYFYQAEDGREVYVNPLNVRCLVEEYGSLREGPEWISGEILASESLVMSEESRLRFRYLSHLPLTTSFTLVELKLGRDVLSRDTLAHFAEEFTRRSQARHRREREDKLRAAKAEKWERACLMDPSKYGLSKLPSCPVPEIPVITYVASAQGDIQAALRASPPLPDPIQVSASEPSLEVAEEPSGFSPPSFAQMLKEGKPKPLPPSSTASGDVDPGEGGSTGAGRGREEEGEESEECLPAPAYQNTLGDALQAALTNLTTHSPGKKKKGKKHKSKVLFSM